MLKFIICFIVVTMVTQGTALAADQPGRFVSFDGQKCFVSLSQVGVCTDQSGG